ncbi:MAG: AraC family transcriptional regulator, partial [Candidatus Delongbacteria bacterium]|nr:AraC family transcriptional regulator [Candidatus Delongbacteria bacterium]
MILLFFSLLGILLSGILVFFNIKKNASAVYLGGFFFLVSLYEFIQYAILYSGSINLVAIAFLNLGFPTYLIGPMLYFYVRSVLSDRPGLKMSDLWHFLPMLLFLAGSIPYMLTQWSYKTDIAVKIIEDPLRTFPIFREMFALKGLHIPAVYLSRPALVLIYIIWSSLLIAGFLKKHQERSVLPGQKFVIKWLSVLLGFIFILTLSHSLIGVHTYMIANMTVFYTLNTLQVISFAGLAGLLISPFFFPSILYGLPRVPQVASDSAEQIHQTDDGTEIGEDTSSKEPGFAAEYLENIGQKVEEVMKDQKPYLNSDLNLNSFSKIVNIPAHHLAYYFREIKKEAFNDYRNCCRVLHAKELISEGKAKEITLEGIGLSSGFSSRTTFFRAFKKCENIS